VRTNENCSIVFENGESPVLVKEQEGSSDDDSFSRRGSEKGIKAMYACLLFYFAASSLGEVIRP
jgi:hypothetical protein